MHQRFAGQFVARPCSFFLVADVRFSSRNRGSDVIARASDDGIGFRNGRFDSPVPLASWVLRNRPILTSGHLERMPIAVTFASLLEPDAISRPITILPMCKIVPWSACSVHDPSEHSSRTTQLCGRHLRSSVVVNRILTDDIDVISRGGLISRVGHVIDDLFCPFPNLMCGARHSGSFTLVIDGFGTG